MDSDGNFIGYKANYFSLFFEGPYTMDQFQPDEEDQLILDYLGIELQPIISPKQMADTFRELLTLANLNKDVLLKPNARGFTIIDQVKYLELVEIEEVIKEFIA
jgi:hypothetical protein